MELSGHAHRHLIQLYLYVKCTPVKLLQMLLTICWSFQFTYVVGSIHHACLGFFLSLFADDWEAQAFLFTLSIYRLLGSFSNNELSSDQLMLSLWPFVLLRMWEDSHTMRQWSSVIVLQSFRRSLKTSLQSSVKHGRGSLMVWGVIKASGVGVLSKLMELWR